MDHGILVLKGILIEVEFAAAKIAVAAAVEQGLVEIIELVDDLLH